MKLILANILGLFISFISFAQNYNFDIKEEKVELNELKNNAFVINVYENSKKEIEQEWKSYLKKIDGKLTDKKSEITVKNAFLKDMSTLPFNLYSKVVEGKDNNILYVSIDLGGAYLSSSEHSDEYQVISDFIGKFAQEATIDGVNDQLKTAEKNLSKSETELDKLIKEKEKLTENIEGWKKDIEKAKNDIVNNESEQEVKAKQITEEKKEIKDVKNKLFKVK